MSRNGIFRSLIDLWPRPATAEADEDAGGAFSPQRLRQRRLARLRQHGIPAWSEQPEHCDACGRELLTGERPLLVRRGDALAVACPLCAEALLDDGCPRVACGPDPDEAEGRRPPLHY
jgi:hypothetical protein